MLGGHAFLLKCCCPHNVDSCTVWPKRREETTMQRRLKKVSRIPDRSLGKAAKVVLTSTIFLLAALAIALPTASLGVWEDLGNIDGYQNVEAYGINTKGQVVAIASGPPIDTTPEFEAIVWDPSPPIPQWRALYDAPEYTWGKPSSAAFHINEAGDVAGYFADVNNQYHAVLWTAEGLMVDLSYSSGNAQQSNAFACNDRSATDTVQVVGWSDWNVEPYTCLTTLWTVNTVSSTPTVTATKLPHDYGVTLIPRDINSLGAVVGYALFSSPEAFYYDKDLGFKILPKLDPSGETLAFGINNGGQIAGYSHQTGVATRAVVWGNQDVVPSTLESVGPGISGSMAYAINDVGQVAGMSSGTSVGDQAVVWDFTKPGYPRVELGKPSGTAQSVANGIDRLGHVTGTSGGSDGLGTRVFLWTPNAPPEAMFTTQWVGSPETLTVRFDASSSYDPDGTIVSYNWDFGDGQTDAGMLVTHTYQNPGSYTVILTVTDDDGSTASTSQPLDGTNVPEQEIAKLVDATIDTWTKSPKTKASLLDKLAVAKHLMEARKTGGDAPAIGARKTGGEAPANMLQVFDNMLVTYTVVGEINPGDGWDLTCQANLVIALLTDHVMIDGVPCYKWQNGCGPTAAGMIIGYWDRNGFGDLVNGNSDTLVQTPDVNAMIASKEHYEDYSLGWDAASKKWVLDNSQVILPDNSSVGTPHQPNCLADFMHTSWSSDGLWYGATDCNSVCDALEQYTASKGAYVGVATQLHAASLSWKDLKYQVDTNHPMAMTIDYNGDGDTDHLVTVIGYCEIGSARLYAFYSTWDYSIWWANFDLMHKGIYYGVYSGFTFDITDVTPSQ